MTSIEQESDIDLYESLFGDLWSSSILRYSILRLEEDIHIPNGEIIFTSEEGNKSEEVLYSEGEFEIREKQIPKTFDLLREILGCKYDIGTECKFKMEKRRPEQIFNNEPQSRVFKKRPYTELHAVFEPERYDDYIDEYAEKAEELQEELQRAQEPYYDISRSEYAYFTHHFRNSSKSEPALLLFAETGIELNISMEEGTVTVVIPPEIKSETALCYLPLRPYGKKKGWRVNLKDENLSETDDGRLKFVDQPDLEGINQTRIQLLVGEELIRIERENIPSKIAGQDLLNPRYRLMNEYDQSNYLESYLTGESGDFELAVLNVFSAAGYFVQTFGDSKFNIPNHSENKNKTQYKEIDLIAHHPNQEYVLFVECTKKGIFKKKDIISRVTNIANEVFNLEPNTERSVSSMSANASIVPIVATCQNLDQIDDNVISEMKDMGIRIIDGETLKEIYKKCAGEDGTIEFA